MNSRDITVETVRIVASATPGAGGTALTAVTGQAALSLLIGVLTVALLVLQITLAVRKLRRRENEA